MRVLYLGDIVGRTARTRVVERLPGYIQSMNLDFVVVNAENAAGGFGVTAEICNQLFAAGADCIVLGNHAWDQRDIVGYIEQEPRLLRPLNFPPKTPGKGVNIYESRNGKRVMVLQVMGRIFMDPLDCPFAAADNVLNKVKLGRDVDVILADMHGEATSEKMAFGHYLDGRVSMVAGTHTHVPTADIQILPNGTAYQSDVGMCGDYDSVIGMEKDEPLRRFTRKIPGGRFAPALGEPTLCGLLIETDKESGLAVDAQPLREGGRLAACLPSATFA